MKLYLMILVSWFCLITAAFAVDAGVAMDGTSRNTPETGNPNLMLDAVQMYQKHLSPVLGGNCPMYPSCSQYSADAIKKHGALLGWIMTCDRLMRCGRDELNQSEPIRIHQHHRCNDPVSNNDFWLK